MSSGKVCDAAHIIPRHVLKSVTERAQAGAMGELESLLLWRDEFAKELNHGEILQGMAEFSKAMLISRETFRRKLWQIRGYKREDLERWIASGACFEHFEVAGSLAELSKKPPKQLLDEAIELGDEHGKTMSVENLTTHALGEKYSPHTFKAFSLLSRLAALAPKSDWDAEKQNRYKNLIEQFKEFWK